LEFTIPGPCSFNSFVFPLIDSVVSEVLHCQCLLRLNGSENHVLPNLWLLEFQAGSFTQQVVLVHFAISSSLLLFVKSKSLCDLPRGFAVCYVQVLPMSYPKSSLV